MQRTLFVVDTAKSRASNVSEIKGTLRIRNPNSENFEQMSTTTTTEQICPAESQHDYNNQNVENAQEKNPMIMLANTAEKYLSEPTFDSGNDIQGSCSSHSDNDSSQGSIKLQDHIFCQQEHESSPPHFGSPESSPFPSVSEQSRKRDRQEMNQDSDKQKISYKRTKNDVIWNNMYTRLLLFKEKTGHCLVPHTYEDKKLVAWIDTQRILHSRQERIGSSSLPRKSRKGNDQNTNEGNGTDEQEISKDKRVNIRLTKERKEKLDSVGFVWSIRALKNEEIWEEMFTALLKYKEEHGDCLVRTRSQKPNRNAKLAKWVETTRSEYAKLKSVQDPETGATRLIPSAKLTASRIKRLEEIGFKFRIKGKARREVAVAASYSQLNDSVIETKSTSAKDPVSRKVSIQEENQKQWDQMFHHLVAYKELHGDTKVPKRYQEVKQLGTWVDTQRVQYKKLQQRIENGEINAKRSRLTEDRIEKLNGIGFVWSIRDDWRTHFNSLLQYKNTKGDCNVPARYPANKKLGIWTMSQRQQYKKYQAGKASSLTDERIRLLEEIGFTWAVRSKSTETPIENESIVAPVTLPPLAIEGDSQQKEAHMLQDGIIMYHIEEQCNRVGTNSTNYSISDQASQVSHMV